MKRFHTSRKRRSAFCSIATGFSKHWHRVRQELGELENKYQLAFRQTGKTISTLAEYRSEQNKIVYAKTAPVIRRALKLMNSNLAK